MDMIQYFGVSTELCKEDFLRRLKVGSSGDQIRELRECLFSDALKYKLAVDGDVLVSRRKSSVVSVKDKHAEDIWALVGAIQRCEVVPRVLLKNGKRRKEELVIRRTTPRVKENKSSCEDNTVDTSSCEGSLYDNIDSGDSSSPCSGGKAGGTEGTNSEGVGSRLCGANSGSDMMCGDDSASVDKMDGDSSVRSSGDGSGGGKSMGDNSVS